MRTRLLLLRAAIGATTIALLIALAALALPPSVVAQGFNSVRLYGHGSSGQPIPLVSTTAGSLQTMDMGVSTSFTAQSATGQTASYDTGVVDDHSIQLVVTGTPAGCTYRLRGSNDGATWYNISAADITCTSTTQAYEQNKPARYVQGNLLTLSGGTAPTVRLHYAGK